MKSKKIGFVLFGILAIALAVSCASAPPPETPAPPPAQETPPPPPPAAPPAQNPDTLPPGQAELAALEAAAARAESLRNMALDFDAPSFFPEDWDSADALYSLAEQQRKVSTQREARESAARYDSASAAFEELLEKAIAQFYELKQSEIYYAREAAFNAGAHVFLPDHIVKAENTVELAEEKHKENDFYAAREAAENAISMFSTLTIAMDAMQVREELLSRGFYVYDPLMMELADDAVINTSLYYNLGYLPAARDNADRALQFYTAVLFTGWEAYTAESSARASAERERAIELRANVAMRQEFYAADVAFSQGNTALARQNYEEAAQFFNECEVMFAAINSITLEKRREAEAALRRADERVAESDQTARNADLILEGGAR